jgi:hypothetical protein
MEQYSLSMSNGYGPMLNRTANVTGVSNLNDSQYNHGKKGVKSGMGFNNNNLIDTGHHMPTAGSVQTQRKRRQIMHDNLTNSRGAQRMQQFQNTEDMSQYTGGRNGGAIGMQSPPTLPNQRQMGGPNFQNVFVNQGEG